MVKSFSSSSLNASNLEQRFTEFLTQYRSDLFSITLSSQDNKELFPHKFLSILKSSQFDLQNIISTVNVQNTDEVKLYNELVPFADDDDIFMIRLLFFSTHSDKIQVDSDKIQVDSRELFTNILKIITSLSKNSKIEAYTIERLLVVVNIFSPRLSNSEQLYLRAFCKNLLNHYYSFLKEADANWLANVCFGLLVRNSDIESEIINMFVSDFVNEQVSKTKYKAFEKVYGEGNNLRLFTYLLQQRVTELTNLSQTTSFSFEDITLHHCKLLNNDTFLSVSQKVEALEDIFNIVKFHFADLKGDRWLHKLMINKHYRDNYYALLKGLMKEKGTNECPLLNKVFEHSSGEHIPVCPQYMNHSLSPHEKSQLKYHSDELARQIIELADQIAESKVKSERMYSESLSQNTYLLV